MIFTLRKATTTDSLFFYEVKKIVLRRYVEEIWGWDEAFQVKFHNEHYHPELSYIIKIEDKSVGTFEKRVDAESIFISSLYILPSFQGRGIGGAIVQLCIQEAEKEDKAVELEVLKLNMGAQRLYERLGFRIVEERGDDTKIFMRKR